MPKLRKSKENRGSGVEMGFWNPGWALLGFSLSGPLPELEETRRSFRTVGLSA